MALTDRLSHAWNAFIGRDPTEYKDIGPGNYYRPDRPRVLASNDKTIISSIITRIALDAAAVNIQHVRLDEQDRFSEIIDSSLNDCLTLDANIDQTGRAFRQDIVMSMLDEGVVAICPTSSKENPLINEAFDITSLRTGKVVEWYPEHVKVELFDQATQQKRQMIYPKRSVSIIENPFFSVMNEPNSTLRRLTKKLSLLDYVDEQSGYGKLDLIIQLPYTIRTEQRRKEAEKRRKEIEMQLSSSKYGIAYADGTEHITQLNRSLENNLLVQIEMLRNELFSQLGLTIEIMNGTADENAMNNYFNRTIEPILSAITDEMKRKFLTKTARTQRQSICFFRDPFKLVPVTQLAELADKFTRNEIMTSNELRQISGMKPSLDPNADELRNKNLSQSKEEIEAKNGGTETPEEPMSEEDVNTSNAQLDDLDSQLDGLLKEIGQ